MDAMLTRLADPYTRARIRQKLAEIGFTNFGRLESWADIRIANFADRGSGQDNRRPRPRARPGPARCGL